MAESHSPKWPSAEPASRAWSAEWWWSHRWPGFGWFQQPAWEAGRDIAAFFGPLRTWIGETSELSTAQLLCISFRLTCYSTFFTASWVCNSVDKLLSLFVQHKKWMYIRQGPLVQYQIQFASICIGMNTLILGTHWTSRARMQANLSSSSIWAENQNQKLGCPVPLFHTFPSPRVQMDTLWWTNIAIENGHRNSGFSH